MRAAEAQAGKGRAWEARRARGSGAPAPARPTCCCLAAVTASTTSAAEPASTGGVVWMPRAEGARHAAATRPAAGSSLPASARSTRPAAVATGGRASDAKARRPAAGCPWQGAGAARRAPVAAATAIAGSAAASTACAKASRPLPPPWARISDPSSAWGPILTVCWVSKQTRRARDHPTVRNGTGQRDGEPKYVTIVPTA